MRQLRKAFLSLETSGQGSACRNVVCMQNQAWRRDSAGREHIEDQLTSELGQSWTSMSMHDLCRLLLSMLGGTMQGHEDSREHGHPGCKPTQGQYYALQGAFLNRKIEITVGTTHLPGKEWLWGSRIICENPKTWACYQGF